MMTPQTLPPAIFAAYAEKLRRRLGFAFEGIREVALTSGVLRLCKLHDERPDSLLERLDRDHHLWTAMVEAVTIGETYFFRRPDHFEVVRSILERATGPIHLWSAGCATGEEPYSLAILAAEVLGPEASSRVSILGTDVNPAFLARAQHAVYRPWSFRGLSRARLERYFMPEGQEYRLCPSVAAMVTFRPLNLMEEASSWPCELDVILCRNVTVYFGVEEARDAVVRLGRCLRSGGWLIQDATDPRVDVPDLTPSRLQDVFVLCRERRNGNSRSAATLDPSAELAPSGPSTFAQQSGPSTRAQPSGPSTFAQPSGPSARAQSTSSPFADAQTNVQERLERTSFERAAQPKSSPRTRAPAPSADPPNSGDAASPPLSTAATEARRLADAGHIDAAMALLDEATRDDPFSADLHTLRSFLEQRRGRHDLALDAAHRALLLDPANLPAHFARISSLITLRQWARAQKALVRVRRRMNAQGTGVGWGVLSRAEMEGLWTSFSSIVAKENQ